MAANGTDASTIVFNVRGGHLWMQTADSAIPAVQLSLLPGNGRIPDLVACAQAPGSTPGAVNLSLVVADGDRHDVLHAVVRNVAQLLVTRTLSMRIFSNVMSSAVPISKVTHAGDGMFVSADDQALHYAQIGSPRVQLFQLAAATSAATLAASGPLAEVLAAKDAIATFLDNLCDQLPNMAAAVEKTVSQEIFNALGTEIKAQQQNLGKIFDKPLTSFISQHTQNVRTAAAAKATAAGGANDAAARANDAGVRRLLLEKLDVQRYFDPFAVPAHTTLRPAALARSAGADPDPLEALGKLFASFTTLLGAKELASLLNMGATDLLNAVSGTAPFSSVLDDFFNVFKIDDAMNALHGVFSGGQFSSLLGQLNLKSYLQQPVQNSFFIAFYNHYYPGKTFTIGDLIAFLAALLGFVAFEVQGKEDEFHAVFADQHSAADFTNVPATLVAIINGTAPARALPPLPALARAALSAPPPPDGVGQACSAILTLIFGTFGAVSFGTGLMASPIAGALAASISQCIGGIVNNLNVDDAKYDLLSGFAGGFSGAFISTLIGNNVFGAWAQRGATPSARIGKLQLIMAGFVLTLGGGGGAVVAAIVKNYAKTGKFNLVDTLALTTGFIGGFGGGAMGCGLHFMGGISGSTCLPVPLSLAEANVLALPAIVGIPPVVPIVMNNATVLPLPNPLFPPVLPGQAMGVYTTRFADGAAVPDAGLSLAMVKRQEFVKMDAVGPTGYFGRRERLFWLEDAAGVAPAVGRIADLVIGIHGIGRFVFPCITHRDGDTLVNYTRPMYKTDFVQFVAAQPEVSALLRRISGRAPIVKLMVCFSALPLGCCSLGQELATRLNATVYAGRPPVLPWLDSQGMPYVPLLGWIKYTP